VDTAEIDRQVAQFAATYPFKLDPFQVTAIRTFLTGDSVMVAAPTGTGKTLIAEMGIYEGVRRRGRVFYTTPIKALSNQKFRDLRATYAEEVGLLTGDISENPGAQIVVMTTEVLRNMLLQTPWELDAVDVIIFDEIHYLADPERGTTWEESIILCPEHIQLVCLSATVSNAGEIAAWIGRTHRPITLITHLDRAVPLALYYFLDGEARLVIDHTGRQVANFNRVGGEVRRRGAGGAPAGPDASRVEPHPNDVVRALRVEKLLPAIYFLFSRRDCERYAELCAGLRLDFVADFGPAARADIESIIAAHLGQMGNADRQLEQVQLVARLARRGIGFHHAGLLPILKQLVEQLFARGLMGVVFATDTLALGVNMPARSVVVGRMSKWDGQRTRPLIPNEFQQMAGRAGRRGMDAEGHVLVPYSPYITFEETLAIATGPLHPVRSAFKIRYNTVLNLWDPPRGERVRQLLGQSLAQFQTARRIRDLEDEALAAGARADAAPRGCLIGYDDGDDLLHEYGRLGKAIDAATAKERSVLAELDAVRQSLVSAPWHEPGRQALRNAFRVLAPGSLVHLRDRGWAAFAGRGNGNGVGLFLPLDPFAAAGAGDEAAPLPVMLVQEYRQIDYLTPQGAWVELPQALMDLQLPQHDAAAIVGAGEVARMRAEAAALDLPDLDAWAARHREERARAIAEETAALEAALADARTKVTELTARRTAHVCHACPVRKEHRNNLREAERLDRERADLDSRLADEMRREEERVRLLIRGIANILHRFGYLHRGEPTPKADTLAGVFDNNGLIITEMLDRGVFDDLRPADVAEVFSWFAFDRDFRGTNRYQLPVHLIERRDRIDDIERAVIATERQNDLFISTGYNESFFGVVRAWCEGAVMARLTEAIELSEGDIVLTINKTLDLMRQVRTMLGTTMPQHPLRSTLAAAERLALRDIVAQSYTFGFLPQSPDGSEAEAINLAAGEEEAGAGGVEAVTEGEDE
jgi:ATP-dependent RNA helicase HelY